MSSKASIFKQEQKVENYYRYHAGIYDATRWSFLFGRQQILQDLPDLPASPRILEVGCGTGKNIQLLEYLFPDSMIYGIDLSKAMLKKARKKVDSRQVTLINQPYGTKDLEVEPFDLILFSYSLSMVGDDIDQILQQVYEDLKPKGVIAVVDFYDTPFRWFQTWMKNNHVAINGRLMVLLKKYFSESNSSTHKAYLGLWQYFTFLGKRK